MAADRRQWHSALADSPSTGDGSFGANGDSAHHREPLVLADAVDFRASAHEAAEMLDGLVVRLLDDGGLPLSACARRIWLLDQTSFHGAVEFPLPAGARAVVTVSPQPGVDETHCRAYRATIAVTEIGEAGPDDLSPRLALGRFMPFTDTEAARIRSEMPLTRLIPDLFRDQPLTGFSGIFTIHHMTDFLAVIESAFALGIQPEDITVIDKEYRYLHRQRVDAHLKLRHGLRVFKYSEIQRAVGEHITRSERRGKRILILDNGGYVLPVVMNHYRSKVPWFAGLVEQTTSGIWKLDELDLPVPVFSVAESDLKGTIEPYGVADAAVRNLIALLPNEKLEGRNALVIGYGRIGQEVASILRVRRMQVAVHDRHLVPLVTAHERGFRTDPNLARLVQDWRPLLIFGCAGSSSMTKEHFERLEDDCYLVSTTSRDHEFRLPDLAAISVSRENLGRTGTLYRLRTGIQVLALAHGMPINFHYAESLPNRHSDLVLASVLIGACTLARDEGEFRPGHNLEKTNRALEEIGILRRYYELYNGRSRAVAYAQ